MTDAETAPELLARLYPPLAKYWPNINSASPPQTAFLLLDSFEAFYGGSAGGGKSDALLAAALQYVDTPGYAALILRRTFRQLDQPDAIMARSKEWLMPHRVNGVRWNDDAKRWTFPSGATLTFGYLEHEDDVYNYQGPAYQFVGWDELTQFQERPYTWLFSRTRRRKDLKELGVPIRHRSASNPGGVGHAWVKRRFITEKTREKGAVFIPARVDDNPGLDVEEYKESLGHLDETLRQQYLEGNWGVFDLAAFHVTDDHKIDAFQLDDSIDRYEALDYGMNGAPLGLWATDYEGNIVCVDLRYWRDALPSDMTPDWIEIRKHAWGIRNVCYCDPSVWHRTGGKNKWGRPQMLADEFADNGVPLVEANNDPRAGLSRLRELLKLDYGDAEKDRPPHRFPPWHPKAGEPGAPRLFLVKGACDELIEELEAATLQPLDKADGGEKINPEWESRHGHAVAMSRYAVMAKPDASKPAPPTEEDPRAGFLRRHRERIDKEIERLRLSPRARSYIT